ncbi:Uncharacterised protein [Vibrio cholerae]|nr:Uncharacterised protein [Vibrio cholerae]
MESLITPYHYRADHDTQYKRSAHVMHPQRYKVLYLGPRHLPVWYCQR